MEKGSPFILSSHFFELFAEQMGAPEKAELGTFSARTLVSSLSVSVSVSASELAYSSPLPGSALQTCKSMKTVAGIRAAQQPPQLSKPRPSSHRPSLPWRGCTPQSWLSAVGWSHDTSVPADPPSPCPPPQSSTLSQAPAAAPALTGSGACPGRSSGRWRRGRSSAPSAHRWCQWRCRGSRDSASRLQEGALRRGSAPHTPAP